MQGHPPRIARGQDHHCPSCGVRLKAFARYPWHICRDCLELASDHAGRKLVFGNSALSGGLTWCYADDPARLDARSIQVLCLIKNRHILVQEARFGGVVAEPLPGGRVPGLNSRGVVDLRTTDGVDEASHLLQPVRERR